MLLACDRRPCYIPRMDLAHVIQRIATMIGYGMNREEIHNHPSFDVQDEATFFLLYKAAEIIAKDRANPADSRG